MLKRNIYWLMIGIVISHASIAEFMNSNSKLRQFGITDCPECARAHRLQNDELPASIRDIDPAKINEKLKSTPTSFVYGAAAGTFVPNQAANANLAPWQKPAQPMLPSYNVMPQLLGVNPQQPAAVVAQPSIFGPQFVNQFTNMMGNPFISGQQTVQQPVPQLAPQPVQPPVQQSFAPIGRPYFYQI